MDRPRAELERAKANLKRAREAIATHAELAGTPSKPFLHGAGIAEGALKAAEHAVACCETLVVLVERLREPELLRAISDAERAAVHASNAVITAMTLARMPPEWLSE